MKKLLLLLLGVGMSVSYIHAQEADKNPAVYRRSSLCLILMDESKMPKRDVIKKAFISAPMPEKYNDHNLSVRFFSPDTITLTDADRTAFLASQLAGVKAEEKAKNGGGEEATAEPKKKGGFGKALGSISKSVASDASAGLIDTTKKSDYAVKANKFLHDSFVPKQMFDKWFMDKDGKFSMELIKERGMYDASAMDVETAKSSKRGMGLLADAGEQLINSTFVVVTRYRYMSKDELCGEIDAAAQLIAKQFGGAAAMGAKAGVMALKASLGAGYYVRTTSFLFQLDWNEEISQTFYENLWNNPEAYAQANIFSVKFIGEESAWANVKASIFTNKTEEELIEGATINAMDAVLAKLQKKYEVFRTKTPLYTVEPTITAQIGMKEGLEAGDKFEILEQIVDPETNKTSFKRKGTLKVSKDQIWDNRHMADEERAVTGEVQDFKATRFEGSEKGLYQGLLLRQIK